METQQQAEVKEHYLIEGDTGDVSETLGLICFILNVILPGVGTIVAGIIGAKGCNCKTVCIGVAQGVLAGFIIGWIWSILHGKHIYERSKGKK